MKVIILAGGLGTRISEETKTKPKPMVLLDDKPILWHVMNIFASQGFDDFVIATGYLGNIINDWVGSLETSWKIQVLDTGLSTQTGGRIKRCMETFPGQKVIVTYGDGLGNVNIKKLVNFHNENGRLATVTAVRPPARFGHLTLDGSIVVKFGEKLQSDVGWINGGFFVLESAIASKLVGDSEVFENGLLPKIAELSELSAYLHYEFWLPMDTLRDREELSMCARVPVPPWLLIS